MLNNNKQKTSSFLVHFLAYIALTAFSSILWFAWNKVLIYNLSPKLRAERAYESNFLPLFGVSALFIFIGYMIWAIVTRSIPKVFSTLVSRMFSGILCALLPMIIIQLTTFGLSFSDPAMLTEFITFGLTGALFPLVLATIQNKLNLN
jgi:hypothetical protein